MDVSMFIVLLSCLITCAISLQIDGFACMHYILYC